METVLVTGATGLLGNSLARAWAGRYRVIGLARARSLRWPGVESVVADLERREDVLRAVDAARPARVVHAAGWTDVDGCEGDEAKALRVNGEAAGWVAQAAAEAGAHLTYISTDGVFDGERGGYTESDEPRPLNAYGRSKLLGERRSREAHPGAAVLRTGVEGWRPGGPAGLVEWVVTSLASGKRPTLCRDWTRSIVFAANLPGIIERLWSLPGGVYHAAAEAPLDNHAFGRLAARVFGLDPEGVQPILGETLRLKAPRPKNIFLDAARLRAAAGPCVWSVEQGLEAMRRERDGGDAARTAAAVVAAQGAPR